VIGLLAAAVVSYAAKGLDTPGESIRDGLGAIDGDLLASTHGWDGWGAVTAEALGLGGTALEGTGAGTLSGLQISPTVTLPPAVTVGCIGASWLAAAQDVGGITRTPSINSGAPRSLAVSALHTNTLES
jgi:hypothetical protein